ncbi:PTS sugar transporter subunit IIBC [Chryseobacterium sp. CH25]|nr:PTS sugar transporter subunit IIBC [Chryseobacterium sp. CH25]RXM63166.1 PTS sugar transporter subunit IIBC [Chryseobacterium sp. CH1]
MIILSKNGVQLNDNEAKIILEFLYVVAKNYNNSKEKKALTLIL